MIDTKYATVCVGALFVVRIVGYVVTVYAVVVVAFTNKHYPRRKIITSIPS